jgi:hypothetical protein
VKSISNPTNMMSPVSPLSVINVRVTSSVLATVPTAPVQTMTGTGLPSTMVEILENQNRSDQQTAASTADQSTSSSASVAAKSVAMMRRLEQVGALPKQPNLVNPFSLAQEIPDVIRRKQNLLSELVQSNDSWLNRDLPADYRRRNLFGD